MTDTYATVEDLTARLSSAYSVPDNAEQLLERASEVLDFATQGAAQVLWDETEEDLDDPSRVALTRATCDQVEYWLETGEEHDVVGTLGNLQAGRLQLSRTPGMLGPRARRTLLHAGVLWAGARSM